MTFPFSEGAFGPFAAPTLAAQPDGSTLGGKHFYVNPAAGSADDTGGPWPILQEAGVAFEGITGLQAAIDASVADRGDVIHVRRGYWQPTATINFNKQGLTVIGQVWGMNDAQRGEYCTIDSSHTDGPAARITKGTHIYGLGFAGAQASGDDVTAACIVDGNAAATDGYGTWLRGCRFVNWDRNAVNYGLFLRGPAGVRVDDCAFSGGATNALVGGIAIGMSLAAGGRPATGNEIRDCTFQYCTYAIEQLSQGGNLMRNTLIRHNFVIDGGKFLNHNAISGNDGVLVADNYFSTAVGASTFDEALATLETDGIIFSGNHYKADLQQV